MRDLFRANLRRDLVTAGVLLAFATMAMAAAQWGTFSPREPASLTGERDVAFIGDADRTLPSSTPLPRVPMFTTGGSPVADGALPTEPLLPPAAEAAAPPVASSTGGFGTWSAIGTSWHAAGGFGNDGSPFVRGANSASGIGSIAGISGGGAWGGVSGTATKTKETVVAGASSRVVAASKTASSASKAANTSSRNAMPGTAASLSTSAAFSAIAAGPIAPAAAVADAAPAFTPGTVESLKDPALAALRDTPSDSPSSAPTPEPLSFLLVGVGLAGIYAVRKHLR
jgi:hypothetical protein